MCNLPDGAGDPIAATDPVFNSSDGAARELSGEFLCEFLPDEGVDSGLDDMGMVRVMTILSSTESEEEFSKQFHFNIDKRLMETQTIPKYLLLFKTTQEALEIITLLSTWNETGSGKRKSVHHTRQEHVLSYS